MEPPIPRSSAMLHQMALSSKSQSLGIFTFFAVLEWNAIHETWGVSSEFGLDLVTRCKECWSITISST